MGAVGAAVVVVSASCVSGKAGAVEAVAVFGVFLVMAATASLGVDDEAIFN